MKKTILPLLLTGLLLAGSFACKKDDKKTTNSTGTGTTPPVVVANNFEGKVNGTLKKSSNVSGDRANNQLHFVTNDPSFIWEVYLPANLTIGQSYSIADENILLGYGNPPEDAWLATTGTFTIQKNDTVNDIFEMTFNGEFESFAGGNPTIFVTAGKLKCTY